METDAVTTDWTEIGNCGLWGDDPEAIWSIQYETPYNAFIGAINIAHNQDPNNWYGLDGVQV